MNWTDERVELLTKMWEEGMSASQIAAQLGGVSRNAVIGKVHRLKISRPEKLPTSATKKAEIAPPSHEIEDAPEKRVASTAPTDKVKAKIDKTVVKKREETLTSPTSPVVTIKSHVANDTTKETTEKMATSMQKGNGSAPPSGHAKVKAVTAEAPPEEPLSDEAMVAPVSRRLSLLQLTENTCKWPIGDPLGAGFHFCGAKTTEGSPYCSYHSKIAFQPVTDRRRIRA